MCRARNAREEWLTYTFDPHSASAAKVAAITTYEQEDSA